MYSNSVFKYVVSNIDLIIPGEDSITLLTDNVSEMQIDYDYDNNFFPIFRLNTNISLQNIYKIINNINDAQLHLRLCIYEYKNDVESSIKTDLLNKNFIIFMDELTPDLESKMTQIAETSVTNEFLESQSEIELYLFDPLTLYNSKQILNYVFKNCTVFEAMSYCFYKCGINNILISPMENTTTYSQLIIPPVDLLGVLRTIEQVYGIYSTYATLFFDFKRNYLINRTNKVNAKQSGEKTKVTLNIKGSTNNYAVGSSTTENETGYEINVDINSLTISDNSNLNNAIYGNDINNIDLYTGQYTQYETDIKSTVNKRATRITTSNYQNSYSLLSSKHQTEENIYTISIALKDNNVDIFTPNKEYILAFEESDKNVIYGGNYRLSSMTYSLVKDGNRLRVINAALFKKCP